VDEVASVTRALVREMETHAPPRTREIEIAKAKGPRVQALRDARLAAVNLR